MVGKAVDRRRKHWQIPAERVQRLSGSPPMTPSFTSSQRRNIGFKLLFSLACTVIVLAGLKAAAEMIAPILLGMFLAVLTLPLAGWLHAKGLPRPLAVVLAVAVDLLVLSFLVFLTISVMPDFQASAQKYEAKFREVLMKDAVNMQNWLNTRLEPLQKWMAENFGDPEDAEAVRQGLDLKSVAEQVLSLNSLISVVSWLNQANIVPWLISVVTKAFFALIIMVFILFEAEKFEEKVGPMIEARGPNFRRFKTVGRQLQSYLGIKSLASLLTGFLAGLFCWLMGIEFALVWGFVAFLLNFVPVVGSLVASIPPIVIALLQLGFWQGVIVALVYLAINTTIGNVLEPMAMGRGFGISTVVVILSVLFWGWLWGPVGMFLAVPLTMLIKMMLAESDDFRWIAVAMSKDREEAILELLEAEDTPAAKDKAPKAEPAPETEEEEFFHT